VAKRARTEAVITLAQVYRSGILIGPKSNGIEAAIVASPASKKRHFARAAARKKIAPPKWAALLAIYSENPVSLRRDVFPTG
jgi:hypothetical protein